MRAVERRADQEARRPSVACRARQLRRLGRRRPARVHQGEQARPARRAAGGGGRRVSSHARTSVRVTLLDVVAKQLRQPAQSGIELRSVTDAARCEMWTSATLPTRRCGDDLYDIACFETLLNETISNADVNARGGGRARYDDRHRTWVTHAEGVHHRADLTAIVKLAAMDIDLDVPDPLHRFLSGRRPPRSDESLDALLELAVLLEQLLDTARQMLWLRLENGSRLVELPLELANELVR